MQMLYRLSYVGWTTGTSQRAARGWSRTDVCCAATKTWFGVWRERRTLPGRRPRANVDGGKRKHGNLVVPYPGCQRENVVEWTIAAAAGKPGKATLVPRREGKMERETGLEPATSSLEG